MVFSKKILVYIFHYKIPWNHIHSFTVTVFYGQISVFWFEPAFCMIVAQIDELLRCINQISYRNFDFDSVSTHVLWSRFSLEKKLFFPYTFIERKGDCHLASRTSKYMSVSYVERFCHIEYQRHYGEFYPPDHSVHPRSIFFHLYIKNHLNFQFCCEILEEGLTLCPKQVFLESVPRCVVGFILNRLYMVILIGHCLL